MMDSLNESQAQNQLFQIRKLKRQRRSTKTSEKAFNAYEICSTVHIEEQ